MDYPICFSYAEILQELQLSECEAFGVIGSCSTCDLTPWVSTFRNLFQRRITQATEDIRNILGFSICDEQICNERHRIDCPITLRHKPIAWLGTKKVLSSVQVPICYTTRTKLGIPLPSSSKKTCLEDELIGIAIIGELPDGATIDLTSFSYDMETCRLTDLVLEQPCIEEYTDTQVICDEAQVGTGYYAVWPKCQLLHPNCDVVTLSSSTNSDNDCWIESVTVTYYEIDTTTAVSAPTECVCGACDNNCTTQDFTADITDDIYGEICLRSSNDTGWISRCRCDAKYVYINYGTSISCLASASGLSLAVALRTLLLMGKRICGCACNTDQLDWWLDQDPGEQGRALSGPRDYPFGTTRAGVEIQRILSRIKQELSRRGDIQFNAGLLSVRNRNHNWRRVHHT